MASCGIPPKLECPSTELGLMILPLRGSCGGAALSFPTILFIKSIYDLSTISRSSEVDFDQIKFLAA